MGGTGLGLSIVKHLTEHMKGRVGVEPGARRGTIFWVELPIAEIDGVPSEDDADRQSGTSEDGPEPASSKRPASKFERVS
jgi:hypothetical protein